MAEGAALEKRYTVTRYRGFESRPLRHEENVVAGFALGRAAIPGRMPSGVVCTERRFSTVCGQFAGAYAERFQSGRMGAPGKRVSRLRGTVGSNPTLSAIHLFFCILGCQTLI